MLTFTSTFHSDFIYYNNHFRDFPLSMATKNEGETAQVLPL